MGFEEGRCGCVAHPHSYGIVYRGCGKVVQANSVQCTVCKKNGFTSGAVVCVVTCRG